ncbi:VCBS repeat-containing protein [Flagellimonas pacifica]|uniref:Repeat domain-containing protein n=1 Tax=Flagellimonas pacifica TaxID=1247520 RepID=A0A285MQB0_9FLAO|nr:VCBS repeat-containing protein [Allomuricauda parva]SNY99369.1 Repeat domain-containing protein [Allomuricauda parva]
MSKKITVFFICAVSIMLLNCKKSEEKKNEQIIADIPLFETIPSTVSQITFKNDLRETEFMNGIFYEYFYNGSGVAVGDFNNDGWEDIYFVSTLGKNKLYLNEKNMRFKDVTSISLADSGKGFDSGVTVVDINQDGLLDIYICRTGRFEQEEPRKNALMLNMGVSNGVPVFKEMASEFGLDDPSFSTQAGFFDYDKDGDLDMFLINHGIDTYPESQIETFAKTPSKYRGERLFRNDEGKFKDVTQEANIVNNMLGYGLGLAFGDLNNDEWPDIYVSHDFSGQDHMYINQKDGTFQEVAKKSTGHISNFSMGNDIADYNNDGLLDVITVDMMAEDNFGIKTSMSGMNPARFYHHVEVGLHHQYMYNTLQLNNGIDQNDNLPKFSEVAQLGGIASTDWSWSPLFMDMDNDGHKDLFISNGIKRDFRNNDFNIYRKKREEALKAGNIDVRQNFVHDLLNKMPQRKKKNYFYLNNKDLTFKKIEIDQPPTSSTGAAYADFDNDGDIDLVVNNVDDNAFIYKNNTSELTANNYLKVKLIGPTNNKKGIGARITIHQNNNIQVKENYITRGFQSGVSSILHFGLGEASVIDMVEVTWSNGQNQIMDKIASNQTLIVDYKNAVQKTLKSKNDSKPLFRDITQLMQLDAKHEENAFSDFQREELLPHRMSTLGPALAIADINGDNLDDFFHGGAIGQTGKIYLQQPDGTFKTASSNTFLKDKEHEDMSATFQDFDNDGDMDLYVSSGGNEYESGSIYLQDRFYVNDGTGTFSKSTSALPQMHSSASCVVSGDFDDDGDLDLFIGGRQKPGKYPYPGDSYILRNDSSKDIPKFTDVTNELNIDIKNIGMVTDATWSDINKDGKTDLIIVGEWMAPTSFLNTGQGFIKQSTFSNETGWWNTIIETDFDQDNDMDFILGNLGLNYKYKASELEPFEIYANDFDNNNTLDIVLGYYNYGKLFPLRGRECSSNQMPSIKKKFQTYNEFGSATLVDVYGQDKLKEALHYEATNFSSSIIENKGSDGFGIIPLPNYLQLSSINDIVIDDFDNDGIQDAVVVGNLYGSEIETPRNDASYGMFLKGKVNGEYDVIPPHKSGLFVNGDSKVAKVLRTNSGKALLIGKNDGYLQLIKIN